MSFQSGVGRGAGSDGDDQQTGATFTAFGNEDEAGDRVDARL